MKVLLVPSGNPVTINAAEQLAVRLVATGIDAVVQDPEVVDKPAVPTDELSLVVPMGGDGTFLQAAHLIDFASVPLLAFNYGALAFLSGNPERDEVELIVDALAGDVLFERRSTLDAYIESIDDSVTELTALNEIVYARGASGRVVRYTYSINGTSIARLKADGLVVSTPTGSTGYALSAGGPIVSPGYKGLVVLPVAPHALNTRAIVTSPSDVIEVKIEQAAPMTEETSLFLDGRSLDIVQPRYMRIERGKRELLFALGGGDFFSNVSRVFFGGPVPGL